METLLQTKDLKKHFTLKAGVLHAVDGVSLTVNKGETLGVVGESGCGKSTLGRVLLHLHESTSGEIYFKGENITHVNRSKLSDLRKQMQIIFQDPFSSLNPRMTIFQTLAEPLLISGGMHGHAIEKTVYDMMDTVGLARRLVNCYPHELDGGRRQRIGIGRSLILEPEFIVCDEPVSALDVSIQAQIINLLLDIQQERNITYIFITHDLMVVKYISRNIMVMYLGQTVELANSEDIFKKPLHPYTKALLSAVPVPDVDAKRNRIILKGEVSSPIDPKPGCRFAARCQYANDKCRCETPALKMVDTNHWVACHYSGQFDA